MPKKTFRGTPERLAEEIKEWIEDKANEYQHLDAIVELIIDEDY